MLALLLTAALLAADFEADLYVAVNLARLDNGVSALTPNAALGEAADIEASWLVFAMRHKLPWSYHNTSTAWLLDERPDLLWDRLHATYGPTLPQWLGIHDVARLCGYGGLAKDIIGVANKTPESAVTGWLRSPGHRSVLLWTEAVDGGTARRGGGQGAVCVAVFGDF